MKTDFDAKLSSLLTKITSNDTKHLVNGIELKKLKKSDMDYYIEKKNFLRMVHKVVEYFN